MKKQLIKQAPLLGFFLLVTSQPVFADCAVTAPGGAAGGGDVVACTGSDTDGYTGTGNGDDVSLPAGSSLTNTAGNDALSTAGGPDIVTVTGGAVTGVNADAVVLGGSGDTLTMDSGTIVGDTGGIRGNNGVDNITINGGTVSSLVSGPAITGNGGADNITINGGTINGAGNAIQGGSNADTINLNGGTINGDITANGGGDNVTIGGNVVINGTINGNGGTDTLSLALQVPASELAALQSELATKLPAGDSIIINGNTYTWTNFENISDDLSRIVVVPTLQEWGLMLLVVLLGLFGFRNSKRKSFQA